MTHHRVKAIPKQFKSIKDLERVADVRYNDRDYQIGDIITFCEYYNGVYSKDEISAVIAYIDDFGCQHGYVNLSLKNVGAMVVDK